MTGDPGHRESSAVDTRAWDVDAELAAFEAAERERLGLPGNAQATQWHDPMPQEFTADQRAHTTILAGGLTIAHDKFIEAALASLGYHLHALDCPDTEALRFGKEFGNRGQCNPTYFTVGNLIKHLCYLRDEEGIPTQDIITKYLFVTAGACGPCRFGTYVTEYRKALRDSGFDGFRVLLFQQQGGLKQATGDEAGLQIDRAFTIEFLKSIILGDVINLLGYRIRPYELDPGSTNAALEQCKTYITDALNRRRPGLLKALWRVRTTLAAIPVDRTQIKPRVAIIGEFWAMTTEGDGNYQLQRFLEEEGAEVDIQVVTAWALYLIWEKRYDTKQRADLRAEDGGRHGLAGISVRKRLTILWVADRAVRICFHAAARAMGLRKYHLPDMDEIAEISHKFYDNNLRGGEGHMEVGKLIQNVLHNKVNMTVSVKPFGCMPSSGVSDGIQSLITEMYPEAIFVPIETTGDGAVNVYSRIQMQLFKAKQMARKEVQDALGYFGITREGARSYMARSPRLSSALHRSRHRAACTAADVVHELGRRRRWVVALRDDTLDWFSRWAWARALMPAEQGALSE